MDILENENLRELLAKVAADRNAATLATPRITTFNGQSANVQVTNKQPFISGYIHKDPANAASDWVPEYSTLQTGLFLGITATASSDHRYIVPQLKFSLRQFDRYDIAPAPNVPKEKDLLIQVPMLKSTDLETALSIPHGKTAILHVGSVEGDPMNNNHNKDVRQLLLLIRPTLIIHREVQNDASGPGRAATFPAGGM
jgi:hypothetical protein